MSHGIYKEVHAIIAIVKCAIGAGSFSLPFAFHSGGFYTSIVCTILIGLICTWTFGMLVSCQKILSARDSKLLSYAEIGRVSFPNITISIRGESYNIVAITVDTGILLTSIGVSAAYIDFVAETLPLVIMDFSKSDSSVLTRDNIPWLLFPLLLVLLSQKSLKNLTITSLIGDTSVLLGCILVIVYGFLYYPNSMTASNAVFSKVVNADGLTRYFGNTSFLFAIHAVILPVLKDTIINREHSNEVILISYAFITLLNLVFGTLGVILFFDSKCLLNSTIGPCPNVLNNIDHGTLLSVVKLFICIDLVFTIPLVFGASKDIIDRILTMPLAHYLRILVVKSGDYLVVLVDRLHGNYDLVRTWGSEHSNGISTTDNPLNEDSTTPQVQAHANKSEEIEDSVEMIVFNTLHENDIESTSTKIAADQSSGWPNQICSEAYVNDTLAVILSRTISLLIAVNVAIAMPHFGEVISLVGGVVCALTGYILPPLFYMKLCPDSISRYPRLQYCCMYLIVLLGVVSVVLAITMESQ